MSTEFLSTDASLPFSEVVITNGFVFTSGQVGFDAEGKLAEGIEAQIRASLENLKNILELAGANLESVVRTCCYLVDQADLAVFNSIYAEYFPNNKPARSTIVTKLVSDTFLFEIDAVATVS